MDAASRRIADAHTQEHVVTFHTADWTVLAESIARVVRHRTGGKVQGLKVEVRRDGVRLQGRCATFYCKQLAQHAAMDLTPDSVLTNEIEVG
jgi:hypothetical protein